MDAQRVNECETEGHKNRWAEGGGGADRKEGLELELEILFYKDCSLGSVKKPDN